MTYYLRFFVKSVAVLFSRLMMMMVTLEVSWDWRLGDSLQALDDEVSLDRAVLVSRASLRLRTFNLIRSNYLIGMYLHDHND